MPTIQKIFYLDITPEKFIDNCSVVELQEIILLANARLNRKERTPVASEQDAADIVPLPPLKSLSKPAAIEAPPKPSHRKALPKAAPGAAVTKKERSNWTPEEDATLRKLWTSMLGVEIAKKLNRDYKSLMAHAKKLGLIKRNKKTNTRKPPPPEESEPSKRKTKERTTDCISIETGTVFN
ncbi:MAG: hypothetical protein LBF81_05335 [Prevotellaceae bacterium]|jgi:hypothetical protein|nr:hypothetical protein [Prevotellaceae bacterium]